MSFDRNAQRILHETVAPNHGFATEAMKGVPPVAVSGSIIAGQPVQDWVVVATFIYVILQVIWLLLKFVDYFRKKRSISESDDE